MPHRCRRRSATRTPPLTAPELRTWWWLCQRSSRCWRVRARPSKPTPLSRLELRSDFDLDGQFDEVPSGQGVADVDERDAVRGADRADQLVVGLPPFGQVG